MAPIKLRPSLTSVLIACAVLQGCASGNHLRDYQFADATLAGVYDLPPAPEVLTGPFFYGMATIPSRLCFVQVRGLRPNCRPKACVTRSTPQVTGSTRPPVSPIGLWTEPPGYWGPVP